MSRFGRRAFLTGAAGTLAALPFVRGSRADPAFPTRLVIFFSSDGLIHDEWRPMGGETDFTLSPVLAPLERHRDQLLILDGLDMRSSYPEVGDASFGHGHQRGMTSMLTGRELLPGEFYTGGGWASGISVDQHIASALGESTPLPTLDSAVQIPYNATRPLSRMLYAGSERPIMPEQDPAAAFDRLFGAYVPDAEQRELTRRRRGSVLDFVRAEADALRPALGSEDQRRLSAHLEGVRGIERRLDPRFEVGGTCAVPAADGFSIATRPRENGPRITDLQIDLMVQALACDLTRVASLQMGCSRDVAPYPWIDAALATSNHHMMSHADKSDPEIREALVAIDRWHAERFAYLLDGLASVPEGDGTLLDHTVVLWTNCLSDGAAHSRMGMSYVLAGGGNGYLRSGGRLIDYAERPEEERSHNRLLLSLCHAMGVEDEAFGDARHCAGPLADIARL